MNFFIDWFYYLDTEVLKMINLGFADPTMDQIWLQLSHLERQWWFVLIGLPLFLILLVYIYGLSLWKPLLGAGLAVALSDMISYRVIKFYVQRLRPFEDPHVSGWVRHVGDAHGASFPSNHAANCFAGAVVLSWFFPWGRDLFYIFAALVSYSRIALGVHYPSDVIGGAMLGIVVGFLVKHLILYRFRVFRLARTVSVEDIETYNWRKRIRRLGDD
jgi:undecaprenyl-diphosphatase